MMEFSNEEELYQFEKERVPFNYLNSLHKCFKKIESKIL